MSQLEWPLLRISTLRRTVDRARNTLRALEARTSCAVQSNLPVNLHEGQRVLGDASDEDIDRCCKLVTEAGRARLVPLPCFQNFIFGFRPKDNRVCQLSAQQLAANLRPRNGGTGITLVFGRTAIEFGALFIGEVKHRVALRVAETLPQRDRDLRTVVGRQL